MAVGIMIIPIIIGCILLVGFFSLLNLLTYYGVQQDRRLKQKLPRGRGCAAYLSGLSVTIVTIIAGAWELALGFNLHDNLNGAKNPYSLLRNNGTVLLIGMGIILVWYLNVRAFRSITQPPTP